MKKLRQIHLYLGLLFAPSILFFAFTGAYQTFRWNENGTLGALSPLAQQMASIHKNAALQSGEGRRPPRPQAAPQGENQPRGEAQSEGDKPGGGGEGGERGGERRSHLGLKIFFFLMALGLITSTITGVQMAFKYPRERKIVWGLLIAGTIVPIVLLWV